MKVTLKLSQDSAAMEAYQKLTARSCTRVLSELRISATATPTLSAVDGDDGQWRVEEGVSVDAHSVSKEQICNDLWPCLQRTFGLECIHVHQAGHGFNGCIFDWIRETACPARLRRNEMSNKKEN